MSCSPSNIKNCSIELYGWAKLKYDYQALDHGTENVNRPNQQLLGIEGGSAFDWGEFYGFYDLEGIDRNSANRNQVVNLEAHYYLADTGLSLFGKVYSINSTHNNETNQFLGLGYTGLQGNNWWFKPWLASHYVNVNNEFDNLKYSGFNGLALGWTAAYRFNVGSQNFFLGNWNEIEFERNGKYARANHGKTGVNGAVSLGWNATDKISLELAYRYFHNKLGYNNLGDAIVYRVAYSFGS
ncbi:hypothetical protein GZ77_16525 [Endozoicomonas montiporae]|uniref:Ion channel protein Tsx n=1 Tax=Endozoicomonas montiporae TaxID=1027273 RepID=A0A081N5Z0_9GAMM|nr:hypothetical protein GZ77_16525 [Endozoicomonas montiporae]